MSSTIEPAEIHETAAVMDLMTLCMQGMRASGIDQWDHIYPSLPVVEADARAQSLYVIRDHGLPVATICLNEVQPAEYQPLPWQWVTGKALVVHRLCVHPDHRRQGFARQLMEFAESFAAQHGFSSIRLDSYTGNPRAQALYERLGYQRVGQVRFPRRLLPFDCFEKQIVVVA